MAVSQKSLELLNINELKEMQFLGKLPQEENLNSDVVFISVAETQDALSEDNNLLALNIANSLDSISFDDVINDGLSDSQIDMVVGKILSAITDVATKDYKGSTFIEPNEINQVRHILDQEACEDSLKSEIEKELLDFQESITTNYRKSVVDYKNMKLELEDRLFKLEDQKNAIVSQRVSMLMWPFNEKTRVYDNLIYNLKCRIKGCENRIEEITSMRPMAGEKEILQFNMKMKEKFIK